MWLHTIEGPSTIADLIIPWKKKLMFRWMWIISSSKTAKERPKKSLHLAVSPVLQPPSLPIAERIIKCWYWSNIPLYPYKIPIKPPLNGSWFFGCSAKDLMSQDLKNSVAAWYAVCFNLARSARCLRFFLLQQWSMECYGQKKWREGYNRPINPRRFLCRCAPPSNFCFD